MNDFILICGGVGEPEVEGVAEEGIAGGDGPGLELVEGDVNGEVELGVTLVHGFGR
jgi:hypothetical protein